MVFGQSTEEDPSQEIIQREVDYVLNKLSKIKNNESAWNYLNGMMYSFPSAHSLIMTKYSLSFS